MLLAYLASISGFPGDSPVFHFNHDYVTLCAENRNEAEFHLNFLANEGLVSRSVDTTSEVPTMRCTVSGQGWRELQKMKEDGADSADGFIAMSFGATRDPIHTAIDAAIRASGYNPVRIDKFEHLTRIDDEIIARVRRSKFMVADFTEQKAGVYFEAGFMHGLGRPVIWLCEKDELSKLHFDIRQYNMIDYTGADDLESRLFNRIIANLGKGPRSTE